ncbi:MAG: transglutaminase domain-containing protein [Bacilli bacterium]
MKKIIMTGFLLLVVGLSFQYRNEILSVFDDNNNEPTSIVNNAYAKIDNYKYVQLTKDFSPDNIHDIYNIYFTVLNSGMNKFTFYCPKDYKNCLNDIKNISNDIKTLSNINNYVHPYNNFHNIETKYDSNGKVNIIINKLYSKEEINTINIKVDEIIANIINDKQDTNTKVKAIHDYIINNSKYDSLRADNNEIKYKSDKAYGNLIEGYGICGGYADSAYILLSKLGIPVIKISSENHVWNLVNINNNWLHLDLTWDDPIDINGGKDILEYNFFLITNQELEDINTMQHIYDKKVYTMN